MSSIKGAHRQNVAKPFEGFGDKNCLVFLFFFWSFFCVRLSNKLSKKWLFFILYFQVSNAFIFIFISAGPFSLVSLPSLSLSFSPSDPACLSVCLSISLSLCLFDCLSLSLALSLPLSLPLYHSLSIYLSIYHCVCLCLSISLFKFPLKFYLYQ